MTGQGRLCSCAELLREGEQPAPCPIHGWTVEPGRGDSPTINLCPGCAGATGHPSVRCGRCGRPLSGGKS